VSYLDEKVARDAIFVRPEAPAPKNGECREGVAPISSPSRTGVTYPQIVLENGRIRYVERDVPPRDERWAARHGAQQHIWE